MKEALEKLFFGRISGTDFSVLKEQVQCATDEVLGHELQLLWNEMPPATAMDAVVKAEVSYNLQQQIQPERRRRSPEWWKIAAAVLLPLLLSWGTYFYYATSQSPQMFTVMTEGGQKTQVVLPDGTHVWLNSASLLSYSSDFNAGKRRVYLEGEGFFDVKPSERGRFVVETRDVDVVVHGTSFNVSSYEDEEQIDVTLLKGKISLTNRHTQQSFVVMQPNQRATINRADMQWRLSACNAETESLWTRNIIRFEDASSSEVFHKLGRWYGLNIQVENLDTTIRYGFTIKSETLREMLDLINKITPIEYSIIGEEVKIRYK